VSEIGGCQESGRTAEAAWPVSDTIHEVDFGQHCDWMMGPGGRAAKAVGEEE
jgi:hypothetical protein